MRATQVRLVLSIETGRRLGTMSTSLPKYREYPGGTRLYYYLFGVPKKWANGKWMQTNRITVHWNGVLNAECEIYAPALPTMVEYYVNVMLITGRLNAGRISHHKHIVSSECVWCTMGRVGKLTPCSFEATVQSLLLRFSIAIRRGGDGEWWRWWWRMRTDANQTICEIRFLMDLPRATRRNPVRPTLPSVNACMRLQMIQENFYTNVVDTVQSVSNGTSPSGWGFRLISCSLRFVDWNITIFLINKYKFICL